MLVLKILIYIEPVSYTHLDVYKRQVMKRGEIIEEGTFDELMNKKELFYSLYNIGVDKEEITEL